jgi:hypothetical protein
MRSFNDLVLAMISQWCVKPILKNDFICSVVKSTADSGRFTVGVANLFRTQ